jgi:hypothetical protein
MIHAHKILVFAKILDVGVILPMPSSIYAKKANIREKSSEPTTR